MLQFVAGTPPSIAHHHQTGRIIQPRCLHFRAPPPALAIREPRASAQPPPLCALPHFRPTRFGFCFVASHTSLVGLVRHSQALFTTCRQHTHTHAHTHAHSRTYMTSVHWGTHMHAHTYQRRTHTPRTFKDIHDIRSLGHMHALTYSTRERERRGERERARAKERERVTERACE